MKSFFSCYFYPTAIMCVDDDVSFLKWLYAFLEGHNIVHTFHDPFRALEFLEEQEQAYRPHDVSFSTVYALQNDPERYNEVAIVIVDYYMPGMDGLSFCQKLKGSYYQKIILTGEADQKLAVEAFNEGLIEQFVMKSQTDAMKKIQTLSQKMSHQFFINKTYFIAEFLIKSKPDVFSYFTDAECCEKLYTFLEAAMIKEWYLLNDLSEYILIDAQNAKWLLAIHTEASYQQLLQETKSAFLEEPSEEAKAIYNLVQSGKKLPLLSLSQQALDIRHWEPILVEPTKIETTQGLYYALLAKAH